MENLTVMTFEVVPFERLGITNISDSVKLFCSSLENMGYELIKKHLNIMCFRVQNKDELSKHVRTELGYYEQYSWFAAEFCNYLIIAYNQNDILFGLASDGDPEQIGPYDLPANYISGYTEAATISRILTSTLIIPMFLSG